MAAAIGADMRAVGVHQGLSPVLDVVRDYRWGRVEETLGEDPYLVGMLGTAYVRGLEQAGVIATLKHFAGYSASRAARNHAPVSMGPRELRDVILPPFEMADPRGRRAIGDELLLRHRRRPRRRGRRPCSPGSCARNGASSGTVVSDYWAVAFLTTMHRVADTAGEAGALALAAGIDVELPDTLCFGDRLLELVRRGEVDEALVDRSALRVLRQKAELGPARPGLDPGGSAGGRTRLDLGLGRATGTSPASLAERSVVLLANDPEPCRCAADRAASPWSGRAPTTPWRSWVATPTPTTSSAHSPTWGWGSTRLPRWHALRSELPATKITTVPGAGSRSGSRPVRDCRGGRRRRRGRGVHRRRR